MSSVTNKPKNSKNNSKILKEDETQKLIDYYRVRIQEIFNGIRRNGIVPP